MLSAFDYFIRRHEIQLRLMAGLRAYRPNKRYAIDFSASLIIAGPCHIAADTLKEGAGQACSRVLDIASPILLPSLLTSRRHFGASLL